MSGEQVVPILLGMSSGHYALAIQVRVKGCAEERVASAVLRDVAEAGLHGPIRLRTDSESAIVAVAQKVAQLRSGARTVLETISVVSSSSLGSAERWSESLTGLVRVMCAVVQDLWNQELCASSPLLP